MSIAHGAPARDPALPAAATPPDIEAAPPTSVRGRLRPRRLVGWFYWWGLWSVLSVLLAMVLDLTLRLTWLESPWWLEAALLGGVTLPLLGLGWRFFLRRTAARERALLRQRHRAQRQAQRDALTGCLHRGGLVERIDRLNTLAPGVPCGLFVLDLHDFQRVNDACGHAAGDAVVRAVADRLRRLAAQWRHRSEYADAPAVARATLAVVRIGSDELGLWLPGCETDGSAHQTAAALLACLQEPVRVGDLTLHLQGNVGWVLAASGPLPGHEWLTRADAALQHAKRQGPGHAAPFEDEHRALLVRQHALHQALLTTLRQDGLGLALQYQPLVALDDGRLVGCEALLRWHHPQHGPVSPAEFIPVAEGGGLMEALGRWVLQQAVAQLAAWRRRGATGWYLAVNVSRVQLLDPSLPALVRETLQYHHVPPGALCLEITESQPLDDPATRAALQRLRELGVRLALDDFGTGYSSLSALTELPLHAVKIDRRFVDGIENCPYRQALVDSVVRLAGVIGLNVVAEGIETAAQAERLRALGCQHVQGWHISRALDAHVFAEHWLPRATRAAARHDAPGCPAASTCTLADAALCRASAPAL
ncbi:putative signaling protein [Tepidimonas sediminis]|uniref:Putative signaling protein n=1 Tax=Tepidimonas sediminis TaxID=2588941 RepID=A0A554WT94_9BURK|nr:GGDEF domain-containing phosphodiesterase [Tepidimonas sediminis]TSE26787.1 putative signaling protein [Tepidimonas sediminis]